MKTSDYLEAAPTLYLGKNPQYGSILEPSRSIKQVAQPFAAPISAGKNTYVYDAHTYHTKVPPQGIKELIEYYTNPGDVVLDPFCGSGMTGIAATELGRAALLSDLSPAAVFIAYNLNTPVPVDDYLCAVQELLNQSKSLEEKLYSTRCRRCNNAVPQLYMVWSYGMVCNYCQGEFVLWNVARDEKPSVRESTILSTFPCPSCHKLLHKRGLKRTRRYPVQVGYKCCQRGLKESAADVNAFDQALVEQIDRNGVPRHLWFPTATFPEGVNTRQPLLAGIDSVDDCYTTRALYAMAHLWDLATKWPDPAIKQKLLFTITSLYRRVTLFSEFRFWGGSGNTANYNVPGIMNEQNVFKTFQRKANTISWYFRDAPKIIRRLQVSTQSACALSSIPDKSVDYVFTDPPFGANINYSEMNFIWESWLQRYTDVREEAIVNAVQKKSYEEYQKLLTKAFQEIHRVLKDGAWLTVVFHNSSARAWESIRRALIDAGFCIQGTQSFDKKHGTFKMFVSDNAVGYDVMLHCQTSDLPQDSRYVHEAVAQAAVTPFIRTALKNPMRYRVRYLHVSRKDELDYRKLYSEWVSESLSQQLPSIDFEVFRQVVDTILKELPLCADPRR